MMIRLERPARAALLAVVLHLPFVVRYDLHFVPDFAISVLMSRAIAFEHERPVYFWGQAYLGAYGFYVTALLFRLLGVSIPLAALVSLGIWAGGVALTTAVAGRLFGPRGAWWTGLTAAVASPYANHYIAEPYSSYETAPVLAIAVLAAVPWVARAIRTRFTTGVALRWMGLGLLLGFGWWTTQLFLPSVVAAVLALVVTIRPGVAVVRRVLAGLAVAIPAALVGFAPPLLRQPVVLPGGSQPPTFTLASRSVMVENLRVSVATLPAYFNGDPQARQPEGATWSQEIIRGAQGRARVTAVPSALERVHDTAVLVAVLGLLCLAAFAAMRAWRARDAALLAVCLVPLVHLLVLALSAQTAGTFYGARRYWFASLLVFPLLVGNAVVHIERWRRWVRRGATAVLAGLLASSLLTQAWMLTLPDELAAYRALTRQVEVDHFAVVWMPSWNAWLVAALAQGPIQPITRYYDRRPGAYQRAAEASRIAVVGFVGTYLPAVVDLAGMKFTPEAGPAREAGDLRWMSYVRKRR
jgi:hypothetical protein